MNANVTKNLPGPMLATYLVGAFVSTVATWGAAILFRGVVVHWLWNWFVAANLDVPTVNVGEALGLALVVTMFTAAVQRERSENAILSSLVFNVMSLLVGAVLHFIFGV